MCDGVSEGVALCVYILCCVVTAEMSINIRDWCYHGKMHPSPGMQADSCVTVEGAECFVCVGVEGGVITSSLQLLQDYLRALSFLVLTMLVC